MREFRELAPGTGNHSLTMCTMNEPRGPLLNQLNLIVQNVPRAIAFYGRLGLVIEEAAHPDWVQHHATAIMSNGMRLEFDSASFARQWNPGWPTMGRGGVGVVFFSVPERADVDTIFARMTAAGCDVQQPPADAFWGARYAIIADPDGNSVGLMSPIDPARRRPPPTI
jgi:uncharacterized glyoxalase superfamily protein PhnB